MHHAIVIAYADYSAECREVAVQADLAIGGQLACRIEYAVIPEVLLARIAGFLLEIIWIHRPPLADFKRLMNRENVFNEVILVDLYYCIALVPGALDVALDLFATLALQIIVVAALKPCEVD